VRSILWSDLNASELAPYFFDERQALCEGVERVVLRTINETAIALPDEPDADPATVDMALALGMGWAPQRGGPLRYADSIGLASVVARLSYFAERYGRDYAPCDELIRRAEAGESFYGDRDNEMPVGQPAWRMVG
jgi:3-hydroxyacyl-CoA dehydrogenase/enoyl-CoA hydratase/3-hydroxybutyryl-CoA epimerase